VGDRVAARTLGSSRRRRGRRGGRQGGGRAGRASALSAPALHALAVVVLAVALDLAAGDPPNRWHPVAWIGRALAHGRARLCHGSPRALLVAGGALTLGVTAVAALAGGAVAWLAGALGWAGLVLEVPALKSTLAVRGLAAAARAVAEALARGDLDAARAGLAFHLVSRPTGALDAGHVASGAIESLAENLTDALAAPLLFFLVFGLPGALAYRALNTADTMLGYREGALEHFGKVAARLDDLANLVPAPLAALAIVAAAGRRTRAAWSALARDHERTASPNAGWTMAAAAGALGVTLEKPGAYRLGEGPLPAAADVERALGLLARAVALLLAVTLAARLAI
jgi:adenosylcobinamide-phosphate synthase